MAERAGAVLAAADWDKAACVDEVLIDFDRRFRRRYLLRTEGGRDILLDLPQAVRLREGDGLVLDSGGIVQVRARAEALMEITASPDILLRIAWHLGNRHLPVQFLHTCLRLREDGVIADMAAGVGGAVRGVTAPFDPEAGAYAGGHSHMHDEDEDTHHHD